MSRRKVLVIAGSNSSRSINRLFAQYVAGHLKSEEIISIDLNHFSMPIYSEDAEKEEGFPPLAHTFLQIIREADAIILSLAEHNGSYTVAFKNIVDWASRINRNVFSFKPMLLLSTSEGKNGGRQVMEAALSYFPYLAAAIVGHLSLPKFSENFNVETSELENAEMREKAISLIRQLEWEMYWDKEEFTFTSS